MERIIARYVGIMMLIENKTVTNGVVELLADINYAIVGMLPSVIVKYSDDVYLAAVSVIGGDMSYIRRVEHINDSESSWDILMATWKNYARYNDTLEDICYYLEHGTKILGSLGVERARKAGRLKTIKHSSSSLLYRHG